MKRYWSKLDRVSIGIPKGWKKPWKKALRARKTTMAGEVRKVVALHIGIWDGKAETWEEARKDKTYG